MNRLYALYDGTTCKYAIGMIGAVSHTGSIVGDSLTVTGQLYYQGIASGVATLAVDVTSSAGAELNLQLQEWGYPNIYGLQNPGGYDGPPDDLSDLIAAVKAMP